MTQAALRVTFAGPLVTYQDAGRFGQKRFGVSASGPMDRLSFAAANMALGNVPEATCIEISMGGLQLECLEGTLSLAVCGGGFTVERDGDQFDAWATFSLEPGQKLSIRPGAQGSWTYLAFAGTVAANQWLDSTATHSMSGFGGGALAAGDAIFLSDTRLSEDRHGTIPRPEFVETSDTMRVVLGPQDDHFTPQSVQRFQSSDFQLTSAFDRMGVRLAGETLDLATGLSIPSEPVARGSVQVAGDGVPTVLLADHQTTGGYPKIATLIADDVDRISQLRAGDSVRFQAITALEAVAIARQSAARKQAYLQAVSEPKGTLTQRLLRENLISGVVYKNTSDHST